MKRVKQIIHYPSINRKECEQYGKGIVTVVLDTGVQMHPQLSDSVYLFRDFVNGFPEMYDDNGHGTHVCGVIAGKEIGIAPAGKIIVLKVLDASGNGKVEYSLRGIRWILENQEKYNIRIVNISMGMERYSNRRGEEAILKAVEVLWDMGITVVAAAGNLGPAPGSITIPGICKKVITVGASEGKNYSGRGSLKQNILKPDLVVPGTGVYSCNVLFGEEGETMYVAKSGTSMSTSIVSGVVSALLSVYPNMTNEEVKRRLQLGCRDLGMDVTRQGSGLLDFEKTIKK